MSVERYGGWQDAERLNVYFQVEIPGLVSDADAELVAMIDHALFKATMPVPAGLRAWGLNNRSHMDARMSQAVSLTALNATLGEAMQTRGTT